MTGPQRIQFRRVRGYRLPVTAVMIGRPSRYGNPFRISDAHLYGLGDSAQVVVDAFRAWLYREQWLDLFVTEWCRLRDGLPALVGRDLACWCALDRPCHGGPLLELANSPAVLWPQAVP